jgi:enamine deaminase RidA (YjgF/YER057c/UK114 family)
MADQKILNLAQRSTKLQTKSFAENSSMQFPVSAGKVLKGFIVQLKGYVTPTFASAPTLHQHGLMSSLISSISYVDDAGNTHKKVTPEWMRYQQRYLVGAPAPEYYKVNSTSLTSAPTKGTDATPFAVGTTGQSVAFVAATEVSFENKMSTLWSKTFLPTRGNVSSYIQIDTKSFKNIEKDGGSNITACVGDVQVEIQLIEAPLELQDVNFDVFRQSYSQNRISGQLNAALIKLPTGGKIQGIRIALSEGAGLDRISLDKCGNTRFKLIKNGTEIIRDVTLLNLIYENMTKRNQDDLVQGTAYMTLLNNMDYDTALPASSFNTLDLEVTTDPNMTYSPTALLELGLDEILPAFSR